jgi:hypothetical protein
MVRGAQRALAGSQHERLRVVQSRASLAARRLRPANKIRQDLNMIGKRFDRAIMVSIAGASLALAMTGCANFGQQGAQGDGASATGATSLAGTAGPSASANTPTPAANEASPLR